MTMQIFVDAASGNRENMADLGRILLVHKHQNGVIITKASGENRCRKS